MRKFIMILTSLALLGGCDNAQNDEQLTVTNLTIVKGGYEGKTSAENGRHLKKYVSDKVQWIEAAGFPLAGTYTGYEAIEKQEFGRLAEYWQDYRFDVEGYVADGNKVVAYGTYSGVYRATNKAFSARVVHVWKLDNGKITHFEQFVDSVPVINAMK